MRRWLLIILILTIGIAYWHYTRGEGARFVRRTFPCTLLSPCVTVSDSWVA